MKLLLPMAYMFVISKENSSADGKSIDSNENLTYRLMKIETDADINSENKWTSYPVYDEEAYASEYTVPRIRTRFVKNHRRHPYSHYDNQDKQPFYNESNNDDDDDDNQNHNRPTKIKSSRIPDDRDERTTAFRQPQRIIRQRKSKKIKAKKSIKEGSKSSRPNDIEKDFTIPETSDNPDENNYNHHEEEEEETEEKKEKIRKVTIKKKRPIKNVTRVVDSVLQPYRTIVQSNAAANVPNRAIQRHPSLFHPILSKNRPSILKKDSERNRSTLPHKGIKPRDVNFVLRGKNPSGPRILIRRYKQFIAPINGYSFLNRASTVPKNTLNKYRFGPNKRKKFALKPFFSRQWYVKHLPQRMPVSAGVGNYDTLHPYTQPGYENDNANVENDNNSPINGYVTSSSGSQKHSPEPFIDSDQRNTAVPTRLQSKKQRITTEEAMSIPYDVREHRNTEQLAGIHAKETDENIDEEQETDPVEYDDIEVEAVDDGNEERDEQNTEYEGETEKDNQELDTIIKTLNRRPIRKWFR